jgi:hypothetical protein
MSIKTILKTSVAAAALFAVSAPVVSNPADAGLKNGNDNGVTISGAINRSMQYVDNGQSNAWLNTDGGTDNSRLRVLVSGQLTESIKVGGTWEANLPTSNKQGSTTVTEAGANGTVNGGGDVTTWTFRKADVKFTHAVYGSFSIGQGSSSSDNKKSLDSTVNNNAGMSHGGGVAMYDSLGTAQSANIGGKQFSSYFGGRRDRIRYDSPSVAGFGLSASMGDASFYDVGLTYGATFGDLQVAASGQVQHNGGSGVAENYGGSVAVKHSSGLSASTHYGAESGSGQETTGATEINGNAWGAEVGYTTSAMNSLGATSFSFIYTEASDVLLAGMDAESVQFHLRQKMPAGVEVYAAYEVASFEDDVTTTDYDDISVFLAGTKLSF